MTKSTSTRAPSGLGPRGRRLWRQVLRDFEPNLSEIELLTEAARTVDRCEVLETALRDQPLTTAGSRGQVVSHPLLAELRAERQLLSRLLGQLAIPEPEAGDWDGLTASQRSRRAARIRWDRRGGT